MRYVIVGAGAIGGALAARLAQRSGGHPPLLIARGRNGDTIRREGLSLRTPDEHSMVRVDVASGPDEVDLEPDDVLVLTVKTQQADEAIRQWVDRPVAGTGRTAGEVLPILTAMNGVETERIASRYFARVFGVTVWMPAVHLSSGEVIVRIAPVTGVFVIGRYGADADAADRSLLDTLSADWTAGTFKVHVVPDVMPWKHRKLLSNLGNALQALLGNSGPSFAHVAARLRAEAAEIYVQAGIDWPDSSAEDLWRGDIFHDRPVPGAPGDLGGSSWQSVMRGSGSIETDYLNGAIAVIARSIGARAPLNETVQRLARQQAIAGRKPGEMTLAELEEHLAAASD